MQNSPPKSLTLNVKLGEHIPNKKNAHYPGSDGKIKIDKEVKRRVNQLENAIVLSLYSLCQTKESVMDLECRKQLSILLSGLSDDSIREIPSHSWEVEYVEKGNEGVRIEIELL